MNAKDKTYFEKRALEIEDYTYSKGSESVNSINKLFEKSTKKTNDAIYKLYGKYAKDNVITIEQAQEYLTKSEYKNWRMSLEDYITELEKTGSPELAKEIETLSLKSRISREQALLSEIRAEQDLLYANNKDILDPQLADVYKNSYYNNIYNVQSFQGYGSEFVRLDAAQMEKVLRYKNNGKNYSERIWEHRDKLFSDVKNAIAQSFAIGLDARELTKNLSHDYGVSRKNAERLVRTESSFYNGQATLDAYDETEIEEYEYLATLDSVTSEICRSLDGKRFYTKDAVVGVNYNPMHPNCRSTTIPYFGEATNRIAKDTSGKYYEVPPDMSYEQWNKEYIK